MLRQLGGPMDQKTSLKVWLDAGERASQRSPKPMEPVDECTRKAAAACQMLCNVLAVVPLLFLATKFIIAIMRHKAVKILFLISIFYTCYAF